MRRLALVVLCAAAPAMTGCEAWKKLRAYVRGELPDGGTAGLHVDVEPPDGITILLDGVRVASLSPYTANNLRAGVHELEVRAMGFHAFQLPVKLVEGEVLKVPVQLRARPEEAAPGPSRERGAGVAPPPPKAPESIGPRLPPGVKAILLAVASEPESDVRVDGEAMPGKSVELDRAHGRLSVGGVSLRYEIGGAGLLTFVIPEDGATWTRDNEAIAQGAQFRLHRGAVRLKRTQGEVVQAVVIARR
jgi:hypothetical protein